MERRDVGRALLGLGAAALGAGCLSSPPRATGPRTPPTGGTPPPEVVGGEASETLRIVRFDFEESEGGALRVVGRVANDGVNRRTVVLVITIRTDSGTIVERPRVRVDAESESAFAALVTEVSYEEFQDSGELDIELVSAD